MRSQSTVSQELLVPKHDLLLALDAVCMTRKARELAKFIVNTLGFEYSIAQWQIEKALSWNESDTQSVLNELIRIGFIKQQPKLNQYRTYIINKTFMANWRSRDITELSPEERRANFKIVK